MTSCSLKALSSESIGTAWRTLAKRPDGAAPTLSDRLSQRAQIGKSRFDRLIAPTQRVVFGIRNRRRVFLVVALVVRGDLGSEPRMLGLGLRLGQVLDGDFAQRRRSSRRKHAAPSQLAALISRSAAARASAVISAPASMRAISSRRRSAATSTTRVATRLPLSSVLLLMR